MTPIIWVTTAVLTLGSPTGARPAQPPPAAAGSCIQGWVLRDPDALRARMEHLRRQILVRTRTASDARYQVLRPQLARALVARGLLPDDAESILASVDAARRR
jgi:hypothetical protein